MNVHVSSKVSRKEHTPSGDKGRTLCGKWIAETVPTTTDRPSCKVCAVVYDQSLRGIVREMTKEKKIAKDRHFAFGFALSLILLVRTFPNLTSQAYQIFEEADYQFSDFDEIDFDEQDHITLKQIFL